MKDITTLPLYDDLETHDEARVVELYKLWNGTTTRYFNSSDTTITFQSNDYLPAPINRGRVEYNSDLNATTVKIIAGSLTNPVVEYIASNPVEQYWVTISRLHRSIKTYAPLIFYGQIRKINFKGTQAELDCVGVEHFLDVKVPRERYQADCNNVLFDERCGLVATSYKTSTTVASVSSTGLVIGLNASIISGVYAYGWAEAIEHKTQILSNTTSAITVRNPIVGLAVDDIISIYYGCDKKYATCQSRYNNVSNFFGFRWIPTKNPALRIS